MGELCWYRRFCEQWEAYRDLLLYLVSNCVEMYFWLVLYTWMTTHCTCLASFTLSRCDEPVLLHSLSYGIRGQYNGILKYMLFDCSSNEDTRRMKDEVGDKSMSSWQQDLHVWSRRTQNVRLEKQNCCSWARQHHFLFVAASHVHEDIIKPELKTNRTQAEFRSTGQQLLYLSP